MLIHAQYSLVVQYHGSRLFMVYSSYVRSIAFSRSRDSGRIRGPSNPGEGSVEYHTIPELPTITFLVDQAHRYQGLEKMFPVTSGEHTRNNGRLCVVFRCPALYYEAIDTKLE